MNELILKLFQQKNFGFILNQSIRFRIMHEQNTVFIKEYTVIFFFLSVPEILKGQPRFRI